MGPLEAGRPLELSKIKKKRLVIRTRQVYSAAGGINCSKQSRTEKQTWLPTANLTEHARKEAESHPYPPPPTPLAETAQVEVETHLA